MSRAVSTPRLPLSYETACPDCEYGLVWTGTTANDPDPTPTTCETCNGEGVVPIELVECPDCEGTGEIYNNADPTSGQSCECDTCDGTGEVEEPANG